jgi:hypothetical protein
MAIANGEKTLNQKLPIAPCALELLRRRGEEGPGRVSKWVFPARSSPIRLCTGRWLTNSYSFSAKSEAPCSAPSTPQRLGWKFGKVSQSRRDATDKRPPANRRDCMVKD